MAALANASSIAVRKVASIFLKRDDPTLSTPTAASCGSRPRRTASASHICLTPILLSVPPRLKRYPTRSLPFSEALEKTVRQVRRPLVLHFATHGFALQN